MKIRLLFKSTFFPFLALLFLLACGSEDKPAGKERQVGSTAPLFKLNDLEGRPFSLENQKGKVVLLRFWSTQCKSCKEEMPKLETTYQELKPSGMVLVTVNIRDTAEKITEFIEGMGLTFPILIDENRDAAKKYKVFGVPTSFLIDKEGVIRERFFGDLSNVELEKLLRALL
jgi:peroxiredoxin